MRIATRLAVSATAVVLLAILTSNMALAHEGAAEAERAWAAWNVTPEVTLGTLLLGFLYIRGLRRWPKPHHPVGKWQRVSFFLGLAMIWLALQSPIDTLANHLLSVHQVQHLLLRMVAPVLLLLGAPLTPLLRGIPSWVRRGVVRPVVRQPFAQDTYALLTGPIVASVLFLATLYFWQFPFAQNAALRSEPIHYVMHIAMLSTGLLFWWLIIDPKPHRSRVSYGFRSLLLFVTMIPNTLLGAIITFSPPLYEAYREVERVGALSLLDDQQVGGLILWIPGDMMHILLAAYLFFAWARQERSRQELQDSEALTPQRA